MSEEGALTAQPAGRVQGLGGTSRGKGRPIGLGFPFPGNSQGAALGSMPWVLWVTVTSLRVKQATVVIGKYRPGPVGA